MRTSQRVYLYVMAWIGLMLLLLGLVNLSAGLLRLAIPDATTGSPAAGASDVMPWLALAWSLRPSGVSTGCWRIEKLAR